MLVIEKDMQKLFERAGKSYLKLQTKNRIEDSELEELQAVLQMLWGFAKTLPDWGIVEKDIVAMEERVRSIIQGRKFDRQFSVN